MVSGLFNSGLALGATIGPVSVGAITDALGFPWALTIVGVANFCMVSSKLVACNRHDITTTLRKRENIWLV